MTISEDGGRTWQELPPLDLRSAQPFVHDGQLYLLGNLNQTGDIVILRSDDEALDLSALMTGDN